MIKDHKILTPEQAQRLAKRKEQESRGQMKGFSEEFLRPMWILPKSK